MGNIDSIPIVSQFKSLGQVIGGDAKGAKETQEKFAKEKINRIVPIVSQFNSMGHVIADDVNSARAIQEEFLGIFGGRRKRAAIIDEGLIYDNSLHDIPVSMIQRLPGSVTNLKFTEEMSPLSIVDSALSFIFVLKLMSIAHIKSKVYYDEICSGLYRNIQLDECSSILHAALSKFDIGEGVMAADFKVTDNKNPRFKMPKKANIFESFSHSAIQQLKEAFGIMDTDKDGLLSYSDLVAAFAAHGKNIGGGEAQATDNKNPSLLFAEWTKQKKGKEILYTKDNERISVPSNHNNLKPGSVAAARNKFKGLTNNGQKMTGGADASSHSV